VSQITAVRQQVSRERPAPGVDLRPAVC